jgi:hypothetical protein
MMQLDAYLSQFLAPLISQQSAGKEKVTVTEPFSNVLEDSSVKPGHQIVEIGEGKYRIEYQNTTEEKAVGEYQKIQTKSSDSQAQSEKKDQKETTLVQPNIAQFVIHPIFREIHTKSVTPSIKAFITEAAAVIKSVPLENGAQQYQFQFKEPPITVLFETQKQSVKIIVRSQGVDQETIAELETHQKELIKHLEEIFKDQELEFSIKIEPVSDQKKEQYKDSKESEDDQKESVSEHSDSQEGRL